MQKFIIKVITVLLTFLIGLCVSCVWNIFAIPLPVEISASLNSEPAPIETSVCQIEDYSNDFKGKTVSFKATTFAFDRELILYPLHCTMQGDGSNYFLDPTLELRNFRGTNNNLITILQSQRPPSNHPNYKDVKEVDIKVTGIVKEFYDEDGHKIYSVVPEQIEIISAFRQFTPKGAA